MTAADEALQRFDAKQRRQRKMIGLNVDETSGVDHPAHGHEGWVVLKSAGVCTKAFDQHHALPVGAEPVTPENAHLLGRLLDQLSAGEERMEKQLGPGITIGRLDCGCPFFKTPGTVASAVLKAASARLNLEAD